jgi:predicted ArsR family transcriptional regulator
MREQLYTPCTQKYSEHATALATSSCAVVTLKQHMQQACATLETLLSAASRCNVQQRMHRGDNQLTTLSVARLALHATEQSLNICLGAFQLW